MAFPAHAWIQDSKLAETIEESNAIHRVYLCEQLIPFIKQIHERNLGRPAERPLCELVENCYATVMTAMHYIQGKNGTN